MTKPRPADQVDLSKLSGKDRHKLAGRVGSSAMSRPELRVRRALASKSVGYAVDNLTWAILVVAILSRVILPAGTGLSHVLFGLWIASLFLPVEGFLGDAYVRNRKFVRHVDAAALPPTSTSKPALSGGSRSTAVVMLRERYYAVAEAAADSGSLSKGPSRISDELDAALVDADDQVSLLEAGSGDRDRATAAVKRLERAWGAAGYSRGSD